jgi:hypothetical protein
MWRLRLAGAHPGEARGADGRRCWHARNNRDLFLLFDPVARSTWRTAGPYLMGIVFAVVLSPNLWWLVRHDFLPFRYVDQRAANAAHWYQHLTFPVLRTIDNLLTPAPAIALLAIVFGHTDGQNQARAKATSVSPGCICDRVCRALVCFPGRLCGHGIIRIVRA